MRTGNWTAGWRWGLMILLCSGSAAGAENTKAAYPAMAPIGQYQASSVDEIALARSAAPPSISGDADVLILGSHGYETAVHGKNGFACLVERSWAAGFSDPEFWNPKVRGPICFNPAGVRSLLPGYLERTQWVLAGVSKADIIARTKSALAANTFVMPEPGVLAYMLS